MTRRTWLGFWAGRSESRENNDGHRLVLKRSAEMDTLMRPLGQWDELTQLCPVEPHQESTGHCRQRSTAKYDPALLASPYGSPGRAHEPVLPGSRITDQRRGTAELSPVRELAAAMWGLGRMLLETADSVACKHSASSVVPETRRIAVAALKETSGQTPKNSSPN